MVLSKKVREQMLALCDSLSDEDGMAPSEFHKCGRWDRRVVHEYRQLRLCQQVAHTLELILPSAPDRQLSGARVAKVVPSDRASSLIVRIYSGDGGSGRALLESLRAAEGWIRCQVAQAISRKRVPSFAFELCAAPEGAMKARADEA